MKSVHEGDTLVVWKLDRLARWARQLIGKAAIISDLEAMRQSPAAPAWFKLKKAELAALAEREAVQAGWLPAPLQ